MEERRSNRMRTMRLGKTGFEVSRVGMGGIPLTRPTEGEAIRVIHRALDLGVSFIDTAIGHGISEERIGKAVAGRREQVIYQLPIREMIVENTAFYERVAAEHGVQRGPPG
jgi:predicted aldo/keto reductase-like oxidoreductase